MSINNKYQPLYVASDSTITSVENASSNLQFCEVNNSINTISIPTLINQNTNEDLNLSSYNGTSINPIIQINNTYQHVNITSNLNVASNLNVSNNLNIPNNSLINFNFDSKNPGGTGKFLDLIKFKPMQWHINNEVLPSTALVPNTSFLSLGLYEHSLNLKFFDAGSYSEGNTMLSINYDGRIGIGTSYSNNILVVNGNLNVANHTLIEDNNTLGTIGSYNMITKSKSYYALGYSNNISGNVYNSDTYLNCVGNGKIKLSNNETIFMSISKDGNNNKGVIEGLVTINQKDANDKLTINLPTIFNSYTNFNHPSKIVTYKSLINSDQSGNIYFRGENTGNFIESSVTNTDCCAWFKSNIIVENFIFFTSDQRIKKNIKNFINNETLELVRNIKLKKYNYIEHNKSNIGFIAQEVKNVLPSAITYNTDFIPDVYKIINCIWNNTTMTCDILTNVSGIKYKFYVSNNSDGSDETEKIVVGNSDNTFTFEQKYNNVFCFGKQVDNFHILDENKIYKLHHGAIQEIDKIQQQQQTKIINLENETTTLKSETATLKSETTTLKSENELLKSETTTLKSENELLKTQVSELTNIINKLKTSNSFEEFKQIFF